MLYVYSSSRPNSKSEWILHMFSHMLKLTSLVQLRYELLLAEIINQSKGMFVCLSVWLQRQYTWRWFLALTLEVFYTHLSVSSKEEVYALTCILTVKNELLCPCPIGNHFGKISAGWNIIHSIVILKVTARR